MPLDWMVSYSLADVNRLYKNRFQNFMELINLQILDETHFFWRMEYQSILIGTKMH